MDAETAQWVFVAATTAHLGFQSTVTVLVYPALLAVPDDRWASAHRRHGRRVTPLVVATYGAMVLAGAELWVVQPSVTVLLALVPVALCLLLTAAVAAPIHGRLDAAGTDAQGRLRRLLVRVDLGRAACALAAVLGAVAVAVG
jgi:hypothetical protein